MDGPMSIADKDATLDEACGRAVQLQIAGQLESAAAIYREIILEKPSHPIASHCLGMLYVQLRRVAEGLPLLLNALVAQPQNPDYWLGYLEALALAGQADTAHETLGLCRQRGMSGESVDAFTARLAERERQPFIIAAPKYSHHSAGVRLLHTLCEELNLCGYPAYLIFYQFKPGKADFFTSEDASFYCDTHQHIRRLPVSEDMSRYRDLIDRGIVVYPEVIQGNPLNARRVARYVLNYPEANRYPMLESPSDFIVSFNSHYWKKPHAIASIFVEEPLFHDEGTRPALERTMDCTYIGKGVAFGECFRIPGSVLIERYWPSEKDGLAAMLRNTRYFFTWDVNTQTNADALMCGALIVVPRWAPFTPACFNTDFGPIPYVESRLENGVLNIGSVDPDYDVRRRQVIDTVKATARQRTVTVCRLAAAMKSYFGDQMNQGAGGGLMHASAR